MAETLDSVVMMALGEFRFGLSTAAYQTLEREESWRWPAVDSIGDLPHRQFIGKGSDDIRLSGVIFPHFRGGLAQLEAMRAIADKGQPLRMVCGRGVFWGRWAITELRERQLVFFSNGAPRRQEFDLSLAYIDNGHPRFVMSGTPNTYIRPDPNG